MMDGSSVRLLARPVWIVGRTWHVFPQPDGPIEVTTDPSIAQARVEDLHTRLRRRLDSRVEFLDPVVIDEDTDLAALRGRLQREDAADVLLVNLTGGPAVHYTGSSGDAIWDWGIPVIAYSGEHTPMMGLYGLPLDVREKRPHVSFALDLEEVEKRIHLLQVKKRLAHSRMLTVGEYRCAERLPDPDVMRDRLGVEMIPVSSQELLTVASALDSEAVEALAREWSAGSVGESECSRVEVLDGARMYLALERVLREHDAQAASVGCLELMYQHARSPFCFALATLRDVGLPAGCEADAAATLTMLILEYLLDRPAYMGNLVKADPRTNRIGISHGCSPARMAGRDRPAKPYRLVHSHSVPPFSRSLEGGAGVTSYVDYGDVGQEVTVTRLDADVATLLVARGEIVECRDTICDRTTLTMRVRDARDLFHKATGNHQVVVYGDHVAELRELCSLLGLRPIEA